jgi:sugar phosphate isomerase/epimerase
MAGVTRREFLEKSALGSAAASFLMASGAGLNAKPLGLPIGSQTYPFRDRVQSGDFAGLIKDLKTAGIEDVELCSPGYAQFKSLADAKQTRKILDDNGMKSSSGHFSGLSKQQPQMIEWALQIGMTQMSVASLNGKVTNGMTTLDEVKRAADEYNKIGAAAKKAGLQQTLHNEGFENSRLEDGRLTYPVLMEYLDPDLVKMQFQMSSMTTIGDPIMYFTNHPGRFASMHLQGVDVTQGMRSSRAGFPPVKPTPEEAAAAAARQGGGGRERGGAGAPAGGRGPGLALGEDSVDWPRVFAAAKIGGVKTYYVEQSWEIMLRSVAYLKTLNDT